MSVFGRKGSRFSLIRIGVMKVLVDIPPDSIMDISQIMEKGWDKRRSDLKYSHRKHGPANRCPEGREKLEFLQLEKDIEKALRFFRREGMVQAHRVEGRRKKWWSATPSGRYAFHRELHALESSIMEDLQSLPVTIDENSP